MTRMTMKLSVRKKSVKQEKRIAKDLNCKPVPGSGSVWAWKGDVRSDKLLIEAKMTEAEYYNLTLATWEKIVKEAAKDGLRIPVMFIDIQELQLVVIDSVMLPTDSSPSKAMTNGKRVGLNKELPYPISFTIGKYNLVAVRFAEAEEIFDGLI